MGANERKAAIEPLRYRAELRSAGEEEDTGVIEQVAASRAPKSSSVPVPARGVVAVLRELPPAWRGPVLIFVVGVAAASLIGGGFVGSLLTKLGWVK